MSISPATEEIIFTILITGLIGFMLFIIYDLAKSSKAGGFGTLMLFVCLGMGMFGFVMKFVISALMDV